MNILVTGGCGFIGSNFINYFIEKYPDYKIYNLDILYYCASLNNISKPNHENYKFIEGDIKSPDLINFILKEFQITHVIHFAAQSHVDNSFNNSLQYTSDNIMGTHNLLECLRKYQDITNNLKLMIHISTDEVYGESELNESAKTEMSILCPTNPYAATKAGAELLVQSYIHSYKLPIIITRGNNVYGPRQYPEKLIPKFIKLLINNEKCTIHGNGASLRSFIYIDDVVNAFDLILHKGKLGEIYNIGTKNEHNIIDIATRIITLVNDGLLEDNMIYIKDRNFNDKRYYVNYDKLTGLGWEQVISIDEGLLRTYEWTKKIGKTYWKV
jgi:UDP-glucose 4,6-dehydratase